MRVVVYDPFVSAERCRELQVTSGSLENVLLQADFVTLHAPLTDDTRNLINAERLHLMKRGVRIVNAARGDLVDIDALVDALESGQVAGAALDVFPDEPYTSGPHPRARERRRDAAPRRRRPTRPRTGPASSSPSRSPRPSPASSSRTR